MTLHHWVPLSKTLLGNRMDVPFLMVGGLFLRCRRARGRSAVAPRVPEGVTAREMDELGLLTMVPS
jgi:hypothetical protein